MIYHLSLELGLVLRLGLELSLILGLKLCPCYRDVLELCVGDVGGLGEVLGTSNVPHAGDNLQQYNSLIITAPVKQ